MSKNSKLSRNTRTTAAKAQIVAQKYRTEKNKVRKLLKHLKKFINDVQAFTIAKTKGIIK